MDIILSNNYKLSLILIWTVMSPLVLTRISSKSLSINYLLIGSISDFGTKFSLKKTPFNILPDPAEVLASVDIELIAATLW